MMKDVACRRGLVFQSSLLDQFVDVAWRSKTTFDRSILPNKPNTFGGGLNLAKKVSRRLDHGKTQQRPMGVRAAENNFLVMEPMPSIDVPHLNVTAMARRYQKM